MRKLIIALAFGTALLPDAGFTLGLGEIEVNSALNQELNANIELLSAAPEDAESIIIKLASREEFSRAGIDRPFLLQSLKFTSTIRNGVPYIQVTSDKPIREPFLNFLIEIDWPKGHLLREYTILLDPPVFMGTNEGARPAPADSSSRPAPAPVPEDEQAFRPGAGSTAASLTETQSQSQPQDQPQDQPQSQPAPSRQSAASTAAPTAAASTAPVQSGDYRIRQGDTAWSLADSLRPDQSVSIEQMMLAMLRTNPESFIQENINGLKRGYILRIPDRNEIISVVQADAVALVRQQNALWREYQQTLASDEPTTALERPASAATGANADGTATHARLEIVSAGHGAATTGSADISGLSASQLRARLALLQEQLESERVKNDTLQGDVTALEQQVDKMKRLLSIEDQDLAVAQSAVTAATTNSLQNGEEAEPAASTELAESAASDTSVDTSMADEEAAAMTEEAAMPAESTDDETVFVDAEQASDESTAQPAQDQGMPEEQSVAVEFEQPAQPGFIENLLNNPLLLGVIALVALLVAVLVFFIVRKRRTDAMPSTAFTAARHEDADLEDVADMIEDNAVSRKVSDAEVKKSMAEAEAAAEAFNSDATLILSGVGDTVITQAPVVEEEARDDIIAEADVYLAYGIYQQAEELLNNAIAEHPENDAYRMKLAETYFASKNAQAFGALADSMRKRTGGEGGNWKKLVAMGKDLCPNHALFKGTSVVADISLDNLVPSPEPMDFDLGSEASAPAPDLDFSLDDALDMPKGKQGAAKHSAADSELEFDLSEADALAATDDKTPAEEFSLDIDASELDINIEAPSTASAQTEDKSIDVDFSGDLDMDMDLEADVDLTALDDIDEVSTKLDLARAYLDMGDAEGTRSILQEVKAEGNAEQRKEAEALLKELNG